jgi:hypothetical protein
MPNSSPQSITDFFRNIQVTCQVTAVQVWPQGSLAEAKPFNTWGSIAAVVLALESGVGISEGMADYGDPKAAQKATLLKPTVTPAGADSSTPAGEGGRNVTEGVQLSISTVCSTCRQHVTHSGDFQEMNQKSN